MDVTDIDLLLKVGGCCATCKKKLDDWIFGEADSIVRRNAEKDPNYRPYCMRCPGLVRMRIVERFFWRCACGAEHDERGAVAKEKS